MIGSFLGVGFSTQDRAVQPRRSAVRHVAMVLMVVAWSWPVAAGEWQFDYEPGEWRIAAHEQRRDGYLEAEKIAIGCSLSQQLFVQRYTPAGSRPASAVRLDGGPEMIVVWDRVDVPNTMWLFDDKALALTLKLMHARSVAVREIGAIGRAETILSFHGAAAAVQPVLGWCGYSAVATIDGSGEGGTGDKQLDLTAAQ